MARRVMQNDQIVKLIVGAGQASPSPPVGPALGSKGVKSMDFCKEFNARTAHYNPGTPIPALVTVRPDRSFTFSIRTPPTATLLLSAAGVAPTKSKLKGAGKTPGPKAVPATPLPTLNADDEDGASVPAKGPAAPTPKGTVVAAGNSNTSKVGQISLKHIFEIARIKQSETRLQGVELEGLAKSVIAQAGSMGVEVVP